MRVRRLASLVVVAAFVALAAGGCSDDDDGDGDDAATAATDALAFEGDPNSDFCELLRDVQLDGLLEGPVESTADVEAGFTKLIFVLARAAEHAPEELETDVSLVLEGIIAFDAAMRAVGYSYDALEQSPDAPAVSAALNDPSFEVAGDRIEAYKTQVCGL